MMPTINLVNIHHFAIQLTLEQHRFEQHKFTYTQIFFPTKYILHYCMIHCCLNLWIWNFRYGGTTVKLHVDFHVWRIGAPTP